MKRYIAAILCVVAILAVLPGCNSKPGRDKEPAITYVERSDSELEFESSLSEPEKEYIPTNQILDAGLYDGVVQIGDHVLSMPISFSDLKNTEVTQGSVLETYLIDPHSGATADLYIGNTQIRAWFTNPDESLTAISETSASHLTVDGPSVIFAKGIRVGSKLSELTEQWGEPLRQSSGQITRPRHNYQTHETLIYIYEEAPDSNSSYNVIIDRNTAEILEIRYVR